MSLRPLRYRIQQQSGLPLDWQEVARLLPDKAQAYGLSYRGPEDFLDEQVLAGIRRDWRGQFGNFVSDLPAFEQCLSTLYDQLSEIFG